MLKLQLPSSEVVAQPSAGQHREREEPLGAPVIAHPQPPRRCCIAWTQEHAEASTSELGGCSPAERRPASGTRRTARSPGHSAPAAAEALLHCVDAGAC